MELPYGDYLLDDLGVIAVRGIDASKFLQGQLSQDVSKLVPGVPAYAGLHTPQGRVVAVLRLIAQADGVLAILPRELVAGTLERLKKYVLRAKVTLEDASARLCVVGSAQETGRALRCVERAAAITAPSGDRTAWHAADIADGLPQVFAATSETFVAQMLNLDCVGGIAFDKGCYTGQEIIARAHYRGRVKRRMQRFRTRAALALDAGDHGTLADGRAYVVVDAIRNSDGETEFLAVAPWPAETAAAGEIESLPLPYPLPA